MSTLETLSEIIKLCRVMWVEVAPRGCHLDSQGLSTHSSQLCSVMRALRASGENQDALSSHGSARAKLSLPPSLLGEQSRALGRELWQILTHRSFSYTHPHSFPALLLKLSSPRSPQAIPGWQYPHHHVWSRTGRNTSSSGN